MGLGMKKTMLMAMCLALAACSGQSVEQVVKKVQDKSIKDGDAIVVTGVVGKFGAEPEPFVLLQGADKQNAVYGVLPKEALAGLSEGKKITLDCRNIHHQANGKGMLMTSRNCTVK